MMMTCDAPDCFEPATCVGIGEDAGTRGCDTCCDHDGRQCERIAGTRPASGAAGFDKEEG